MPDVVEQVTRRVLAVAPVLDEDREVPALRTFSLP
jgi:hypothetical protein